MLIRVLNARPGTQLSILISSSSVIVKARGQPFHGLDVRPENVGCFHEVYVNVGD